METQGRKLFIGGLSSETTFQGLQDFFEAWGEIIDSVVMYDPQTKKSRGFGFVTFANASSADECLANTPHIIDGKEVETKKAVPKKDTNSSSPAQPKTTKVFLGGLNLSTTEEEIEEVMKPYGEIEEVVIIKEKNSDTPRGFGFVIFKDYETADNVCQERHIKIRDREVEIKKAKPLEEMKRQSGRRSRDNYHDDRSNSRRGGYSNRDDEYRGYYDNPGYPSNYYPNDPYHQNYPGMSGGYQEREPTYSSYRPPYEGGNPMYGGYASSQSGGFGPVRNYGPRAMSGGQMSGNPVGGYPGPGYMGGSQTGGAYPGRNPGGNTRGYHPYRR